MTERSGRIITFYSYKGGTGRSMALANTAWILASGGRRVLAIDWDLEAPGLHRYFAPFLDDKQLVEASGVIEFFQAFVEAAHQARGEDPEWFDELADIDAHIYSLDWEFPDKGVLDFVPAGRQGPGYAAEVNRFDWRSFYQQLGGGIFLEAFKARVRREYDYILIDSRTGLSDTAGICTVQMPDQLVVCFTLNHQSIHGAKAVAEAAITQRAKPTGEPGLYVWPVPTRVELTDKERLEAARSSARDEFQKFLLHLPRADRQDYWGRVEVPHDSYYAYEEVLATFADRSNVRLSVLKSMEAIADYVSDHEIRGLAKIPELRRRATLARFTRKPRSNKPTASCFLLNYLPQDRELAEWLSTALSSRIGIEVMLQGSAERSGETLESTIRGAAGILVVVTQERLDRATPPDVARELELANISGARLVPLLFSLRFTDLDGAPVLRDAARTMGFDGLTPYDRDDALFLAEQLRPLLESQVTDPEDPHRDRFGGQARRNCRTLAARVRPLSEAWFGIELSVAGTDQAPLEGTVEFHLHPALTPSVRRVPVEHNVAKLFVGAYGAFTAGAVTDQGGTRLELDLRTLSDAPSVFRDR